MDIKQKLDTYARSKEPFRPLHYGFSRESLTAFLQDTGFLKKNEKIALWVIERDFLAIDIRREDEGD